MVSLGPEDYGMPEQLFPRRTFLALILITTAIFGYGFYWSKNHPDEIASAQAERAERCDARARKIDKHGKLYCDPVVDAMLNRRW